MAAQNYGLGRGLSSLIPQKNKIREPQKDVNYFQGSVGSNNQAPADIVSAKSGVQEIDIIKIVPNPHQPRLRFDEEKLQELSVSIREHGIIQPLVVTKSESGYEIIAGERRFQAAKLAGLLKVPVVVREATEQQKLELAIIENIQRHDLDPIEEAKSYVKLAQEFGLNQEEVAHKVGKSRSAVANKERLLKLPVEIQKALIDQKITEGHAKAILAIENPEKQRALFEMIIKNNWTVRQVESKTKEISVKTHTRQVSVDPEIKRIEEMLAGVFGTKVKVSRSGSGGKIMIDYYSKEELDNILSRISLK
ncbi:MAG: ParB/RepB/Spo0J family partition protein [Parcubacteria group bacterium]|jgi:ParB family chromosome partitioning protein